MTHIKQKKWPVYSVEHTGRSQLIVFIGRQLVQLFHQMRDNSVAPEGMVLLVDIPHDLPIWDRIVSVLHVASVALIEAIAQQSHHGLPDRLLVVGALAQLFQLAIVYPGDDTQRKYA